MFDIKKNGPRCKTFMYLGTLSLSAYYTIWKGNKYSVHYFEALIFIVGCNYTKHRNYFTLPWMLHSDSFSPYLNVYKGPVWSLLHFTCQQWLGQHNWPGSQVEPVLNSWMTLSASSTSVNLLRCSGELLLLQFVFLIGFWHLCQCDHLNRIIKQNVGRSSSIRIEVAHSL
jgi:hypothetical protein